ncbi:1,2-a-D-mannosidase [Metarhizium album ARSEF 1941]|uniref:alpha-1,2-Mannosidase n=1 Tax=Metarhizium album (strain ARSEF 1941) TaxID=1081103 RepID=A0A0B2WWD8_METAS|nr:1,2-a-D-mannosidase [Metarhizium album ARSEF 1941]KHO00527.1 1,2-a-D-mannosidase [Metarhizium album ARSEF 1941]
MLFGTVCAVVALAISPGCAKPSASFLKRRRLEADASKASQVKQAFRTAWNGYYEHAFPHDTLLPLTGGNSDDRNGLGVTAIDALSTAVVMEEKAIVDQILNYTATIDFSTTKEANSSISLFETNIRYLGGLIAAFDLLKGPMSNLVDDDNSELVEALLTQATTLADSLSIAFDTPTGIPDDSVFLNPTRRIGGSATNGPAGFGTLVLEWTRLSDLTGNKTYAQLAQRAQLYLMSPTGEPEPYPGLIGYTVNIKDGKFQDQSGGWGGGTDSFYEYLIKMYLYDPAEFSYYKDRWVTAAESTMQHLASHPSTRPDLTFLAQYNGKNINNWSGHLASFAGGNFILAGVLLGEARYIEFGLDLASSYYETYRRTPARIGPEGFQWVAADDGRSAPKEQADFYNKAGFWSISGGYVLRPETIESLYYAYRVTGDQKYRDMVWKAFSAVRDLCAGGYGFSGLKDVMREDGGGQDDFQQSFFLAETLKYSYLTFARDSAVQFQARGGNEFVFNTEAHPFRVRQ